MRYKPKKRAISIGDSVKDAALFYEVVYPQSAFPEDLPPNEHLEKLLPKEYHPHYFEDRKNDEAHVTRVKKILKNSPNAEIFAREQAHRNIQKFYIKNGFGKDFELIFPKYQSEMFTSENTQDTEPCFILSNISLINTKKITWNHILSIRDDPESLSNLRRLRTFIFEKFDNKPISFIEDSLGDAIEDYNATAKKHGADLTKSALSILSSEKILNGTAAGAIAIASGATFPYAAAAGFSAAFANVLIEIKTLQSKYHIEQSLSPVKYLVDIKNLEN